MWCPPGGTLYRPTGALPREAALELLFFGLVRPYKGLDLALDAELLLFAD